MHEKNLQQHWFALRPFLAIRNEEQYEQAVEHLNGLIDEIGTDEAHPLYELLDTLGTLIHAYEERHHAIPDCSGREMLGFFMEKHDKGYAMQPGERLNIYLTNTLEPIEPQRNLLLPALSREVEAAQAIKDKPILVITGNPPYSGHSKNKGKWITELIDTYKTVDGKPLGEKNPKWLSDDYVKFIRFAQWKMEQVEEGVVGIITNHSFLDNPTFRGMRQSLMHTFNQIYVLDLHGNTEKKERTPEGNKDENVFDIKQGVAISLLAKKKGLPRSAYHADLWGDRKGKYRTLLEIEKDSMEWQELQPSTPFYLFIPQDEKLREEYEQGWSVTDIFPVNSVGIVTARDNLTIHYTELGLWETVQDFAALEREEAREKYALGQDAKDWKVSLAQQDLQKDGPAKDRMVPVSYRPFDVRWTYYTGRSRGFHCRPRGEVMRHVAMQRNVGILTTRSTKDDWAILATNYIATHKSGSRYDTSYLFPLYLYPPFPGQGKDSLFEDTDSSHSRKENFSAKFRAFVDAKYKHHYSPEEILGYIYAVLHSPTYRETYLDFLKIDFPRIPFVKQRKTFEALSALGWELIQAHLLKSIPQELNVAVTKGDFKVEKPAYDPQHERLHINKTQYFSPVPADGWAFHIGGYQVLDKYLKSRKGRTLSLDEIENVQNVVNVLRFTIGQMRRIDECWKP